MEVINETTSNTDIEPLTDYFDGVQAGNHTHIIPASERFSGAVLEGIRTEFNGF